MHKVVLYSVLLIAGLTLALLVDLTPVYTIISTIDMICLSYIMIEVGLEFTIDKKRLGSYGRDYLIAFTAASFPWLFCALYFIFVIDTEPTAAFLIARFAAPTSAGVLFAMLTGAGLGLTWLFKKARILAIFDDVDTILLMIPLQILIIGWSWQLILMIPILLAFLLVGYFLLHRIHLPVSPVMMLVYALCIVFFTEFVYHSTSIPVEVLIPAFVLGCILFNPHDPERTRVHTHEHAYIEPEGKKQRILDTSIKCLFMFLIGASLPPIQWEAWGLWLTVVHVVALTVLSNIGKSFPTLCYRKEATMRERIALSVAMYPRGEVGAGVLLLSLEYGLGGRAVGLASLSLALNLLLTGLFIWIVVRLVRPVLPTT